MSQQEARFIPLTVTETRQSPTGRWEFRSHPHRCEQGQEQQWMGLVGALVAAAVIRDEHLRPGKWTSRVDLSVDGDGAMHVMMTTDPDRTVWVLTCSHVCEPREWQRVWHSAIAIARINSLA